MRDIDQGSKPALDTRKDVRGKTKAAEGKADLRAASTETWFSRSGLKRRMPRSSFFSGDLSAGRNSPDTEEDDGHQQTLVHRLTWALCLMALLSLCGAAGYLMRSTGQTAKEPSSSGIGQYLQDLAWREVKRNTFSIQNTDMGLSLQACAVRTTLPAIKMVTVEIRERSEEQKHPLDALAIDCSSGTSSLPCQQAAKSNSYEAGTDTLTAEALLQYIKAVGVDPAPGSFDKPTKPAPSGLASLALDCEADPEACAQAASVNSYEGAVVESQSDAFDAYNAWLSSRTKRTKPGLSQPDLLQQLGVDCSQTENAAAQARCKAIRLVNKYENKERLIYHHRIAEEAGPQYLGVSDLDLDCTDVALDVQMECERSRAANIYEYKAHTEDDTAEEPFPAYLKSGRTAGYDVPAIDPDELMLLPEDWAISQLQQEPLKGTAAGEDAGNDLWLKTGRTAGYDVPAVDSGKVAEQQDADQSVVGGRTARYDVIALSEPGSSAAAEDPPLLPQQVPHTRLTESEVAAKVRLQRARSPRGSIPGNPRVYHAEVPGANQERLYFKNPCNNPANRRLYKNMANNPASRLYYKNPLNIPTFLANQETSYMTPAPAATQENSLSVQLRPVFKLIVTFLAIGAAVYLWHHKQGSRLSPENAFPVPELPAGLLPTASKEESPPLSQPASTTDAHSRHYLGGMHLERPEPHHDGADVVPEGIDSPRRAATPGPGMTPRAVSRIGAPMESRVPGSKEGGPAGEDA